MHWTVKLAGWMAAAVAMEVSYLTALFGPGWWS